MEVSGGWNQTQDGIIWFIFTSFDKIIGSILEMYIEDITGLLRKNRLINRQGFFRSKRMCNFLNVICFYRNSYFFKFFILLKFFFFN